MNPVRLLVATTILTLLFATGATAATFTIEIPAGARLGDLQAIPGLNVDDFSFRNRTAYLGTVRDEGMVGYEVIHANGTRTVHFAYASTVGEAMRKLGTDFTRLGATTNATLALLRLQNTALAANITTLEARLEAQAAVLGARIDAAALKGAEVSQNGTKDVLQAVAGVSEQASHLSAMSDQLDQLGHEQAVLKADLAEATASANGQKLWIYALAVSQVAIVALFVMQWRTNRQRQANHPDATAPPPKGKLDGTLTIDEGLATDEPARNGHVPAVVTALVTAPRRRRNRKEREVLEQAAKEQAADQEAMKAADQAAKAHGWPEENQTETNPRPKPRILRYGSQAPSIIEAVPA